MTFDGLTPIPYTIKLIGNLLSKSRLPSKEQIVMIDTVFEWKK